MLASSWPLPGNRYTSTKHIQGRSWGLFVKFEPWPLLCCWSLRFIEAVSPTYAKLRWDWLTNMYTHIKQILKNMIIVTTQNHEWMTMEWSVFSSWLLCCFLFTRALKSLILSIFLWGPLGYWHGFYNSIFRGTLGGIRTSITWRKTAREVRLSSIIVQNWQEFNQNLYLRDINLWYINCNNQ